MSDQSASRAGAAIGAIIFSLFGAAWLMGWSIKTYGVRVPFLAPIALVGLAIFITALRQFRRNRAAYVTACDTPEHKKSSRIFSMVNIGQGVAIFLAANVTKNLGHDEWFIPVFIFIVGAHFLPLGVVFKTKRHYVTGAALILLALLYPLFAQAGPASAVGCLGTGLILWASAIFALLPKQSTGADRAAGFQN
jgi:MFS family permease